MKTPLIFGIGLEKTGTTSLHQALQILGWQSIHNANQVKNSIAETPPLTSLVTQGFNAFCDNPVPRHFHELDNAYPGSKFILTHRSLDSWIASRLRHQYPTLHWDFCLPRRAQSNSTDSNASNEAGVLDASMES